MGTIENGTLGNQAKVTGGALQVISTPPFDADSTLNASYAFTYDSNGNVTQIDMTLPSGDVYRITFTYDSDGNVTDISTWAQV